MLKIFVAGGFNEENPKKKLEQQEFARLLGQQIVEQGHTLLSACLTDFDKAVAESVYEITKERKEDPLKRIISYVLAGQEPVHTFGNIRQSQLQNWELGSPRLRVPEPIQLADAVILTADLKEPIKPLTGRELLKNHCFQSPDSVGRRNKYMVKNWTILNLATASILQKAIMKT